MKFGSLNVRGLAERKKRKAIFDHINQNKLDVCFLQEIHINPDLALDEKNSEWAKESGQRIYYSPGSSQKCGTAIVVNQNLEFELISKQSDTE